MEIWGQIILGVDVAVLLYLLRSVFKLVKVMKEAGQRLVHVFPTPKMLLGTLLINIFGMTATTYSYFVTSNVLYLLFLAVFLLNTFTMFSRIVGIHENGIVMYGRLTTYKEMKKVLWGAEKKKFVELEIKLRDQNAVPLYINVPKDKREEVARLVKNRTMK